MERAGSATVFFLSLSRGRRGPVGSFNWHNHGLVRKCKHNSHIYRNNDRVFFSVSTPPPVPSPQPPAASDAAPAVGAPESGLQLRHYLVMLSFVGMVIAPLLGAGFYLYTLAADQYTSKVGFSVRKEEAGAAVDALIGNIGFSGSSSSDTDILYEYIQSQKLVRTVDEALDLHAIYGKPRFDWYYRLDEDAAIEDLVDYWLSMVRIFYDPGTGLIELEIRAFDPARQALTKFRNETQIVDPTADIQGRMGLVNSLQEQLAEALIDLDLLSENTSQSDPRVTQASRKIEVIEKRITEERAKLGVTGDGGAGAFADLVGKFEILQVDLEFAQKSYLSALAAYDSAAADAGRKSIYLAAYTEPTLAETAIHPRRAIILAVLGVLLLGSWATLVLIYYSLKDRR